MYRVIIFGDPSKGEDYIIEDTTFESWNDADKYLRNRLEYLGKSVTEGKIKAD